MFLCGLDPGTQHCGWAVVREDEALAEAGVWRPARELSPQATRLWLFHQLQALFIKWGPKLLAYEEYVWQEGKTTGRSSMERLMGGIEACTLLPPYPTLVPLLPQVWGAQLYGSQQHGKIQIARAVNLRMGTHYKGNDKDSHMCDAVGIALVALDNWRLQHGFVAP